MIDRDKVIKGLECCTNGQGVICETECPYKATFGGYKCYQRLASDALALLKEQEPVEPFREGFEDYNCGSCGAGLRYEDDLYCPYCGKEIKWG